MGGVQSLLRDLALGLWQSACPSSTLELIGAVLLGVAVFDERLAGSPVAVLTQTVAAGVAVLGIVPLAVSPPARTS